MSQLYEREETYAAWDTCSCSLHLRPGGSGGVGAGRQENCPRYTCFVLLPHDLGLKFPQLFIQLSLNFEGSHGPNSFEKVSSKQRMANSKSEPNKPTISKQWSWCGHDKALGPKKNFLASNSAISSSCSIPVRKSSLNCAGSGI